MSLSADEYNIALPRAAEVALCHSSHSPMLLTSVEIKNAVEVWAMPELTVPAVVPVRRSNDEMREAMDAARDSLDQFLAAARFPKPNQQKFLVKIFFVHKDQVEHIWMENLDMSATPFSGALANDPRLPGLEFGQRKTFAKDRITDWMYFEDGKMVGGYTTKVLVRQQKTQRMAGIKRFFGSRHVN